jgi:hypothetical protein
VRSDEKVEALLPYQPAAARHERLPEGSGVRLLGCLRGDAADVDPIAYNDHPMVAQPDPPQSGQQSRRDAHQKVRSLQGVQAQRLQPRWNVVLNSALDVGLDRHGKWASRRNRHSSSHEQP